MQVSVETLSALERRIKITVPAERLTEVLDQRILQLAKNVKMAGFRQGKVPLKLVRERYLDSARQEALGDLLQATLQAAIDQEKLNPASSPTVEPLAVTVDGPLEFAATFEVMPDIHSVQFEPKNLEKEQVKITETDIDLTLEQIRKQQAQWKGVERAAALGDQVTLNFIGKLDGVAFKGGEAHDYRITLGEGRMVPGFEEGIIGMVPGGEKTIEVTFPAEYFSKDLAGKSTCFELKLLTVSEPVLPEVNADFIRRLGVASGELADLRAEISRNLMQGVKQMLQTRLKNRVFSMLVEQNPLEVPKVFIERETKRLHQASHQHPDHQDKNCQHSADDLAELDKIAKNNVLLGLLVADLIRQHELIVEPAQLQSYLEEISASYEDPMDVVRFYNSNAKALEELRMQLLEEKVLEKLLDGIQLTEKQLSYAELQDQAS